MWLLCFEVLLLKATLSLTLSLYLSLSLSLVDLWQAVGHCATQGKALGVLLYRCRGDSQGVQNNCLPPQRGGTLPSRREVPEDHTRPKVQKAWFNSGCQSDPGAVQCIPVSKCTCIYMYMYVHVHVYCIHYT